MQSDTSSSPVAALLPALRSRHTSPFKLSSPSLPLAPKSHSSLNSLHSVTFTTIAHKQQKIHLR